MNKTFLLFIFYLSPLFANLIYPINNSELNNIHIMFRWEQEDNITSYIFELSNISDFSSPIISHSTVDTTYYVKENIVWQSTYYWRVRLIDDNFSETFSFSTNTPSYQFSEDVNPVEILYYDPEFTFDGITIYGIMSPFYSAAIDMEGNEVWNSGGVDSYMFTLVDNNHTFLGDANLPPNYKGELGVEFTIDNGVIWNQPIYGDSADFLQHDLIKLPNGNYMGFVITDSAHFVPNSDDFSQIPDSYDFSFEDNIPGFSTLPEGISYPWIWKGERIVEWDRDGNEVWSWNVFDYFNLDDFDYISGFWEKVASSGEPFDWTHFNAIVYDETENAIYVSSKNLSRITKIDKASGDVIWNVGKQWLGDDIIEPDILFSGQHGLQLLKNGNLLFFDNGILSGRFDGTNIYKSSAVEIHITDNNDEYVSETIWLYSLPPALYGVVSGNVQKLSNGNYLITTVGSTDGAHSLEVTESYETVWDCKFNVGTPQGPIYRAMRINRLIECSNDIGDMNSDGTYNVMDIVALANCVLSAGCTNINNGCTGDMNGDEAWDVIDIVALANCVLNENCD